MGLAPEAFAALIPAEFVYTWLGWSDGERSRQRQEWERERWSVWVATCIQLADDRDVPAAVGSSNTNAVRTDNRRA